MKRLGLAIALVTSSAHAEELPYPPTYFSEFRVWGSVAVLVAENCPELSFDREEYDRLTEEYFQRLEEDGFTRQNWPNEMREIPRGIADRPKVEFFMAYGIRSDKNVEEFCLAGRIEMRKGTLVGQLLRQAS